MLTRPAQLVRGLAVIVAVGLSIGPVTALVARPPTIDKLTIDNPTDYTLTIHVTDTPGGPIMPVSIAGRRATTTVIDVIDHGDTWIFSFRSQGQDGGTLRITRDQLRDDGWTLHIPASVGAELRTRGAPPSA